MSEPPSLPPPQLPPSPPPIVSPPVSPLPEAPPKDRVDFVIQRIIQALDERLPPRPRGNRVWRVIGNALKTEWKYLLIGAMILVGHYKYHLSLLYYVHELAHTQQEHAALDEQRRANAKIVKHHVDLGNALFGEGEMGEAENEYRQGLKLDSTNLDAQRGLFKASIFNEVDDDTNQRNASPVVILSRIRELACEVQESSCAERARDEPNEQTRETGLQACETDQWRCVRQHEGPIPATGAEGAHVKLLEGMALGGVDPEASAQALRQAIALADGSLPDHLPLAGAPTNLAAAYIRLGDYALGQEDQGLLKNAIASYQVALLAAPWNINALDSLGYALYRSGRLKEARERFEYLSRLDDTLMVAHADLGRTLRSLGVRQGPAAPEIGEAYDEQHSLLSLLTKDPPPVTRDSTSQWIYPVKGRIFDLHEPALKIAYATCAMSTTGHLRGMHAQIALCRRALETPNLTSYQRQTTTEFLQVELDELFELHPTSAEMVRRIGQFRTALSHMP
jgi:tetratricopeptide (TPR) repeat protein